MSEARNTGQKIAVQRSPLSQLGKLTASALVAFALCFVYLQVVIAQTFVPPLAVFAVVALIIAGVVAMGWRWTPLLGATWFVLVFLFSIQIIIADLSNPAALHTFVWQIVTAVVAIVGIVAGIAATVQSYRAGAD